MHDHDRTSALCRISTTRTPEINEYSRQDRPSLFSIRIQALAANTRHKPCGKRGKLAWGGGGVKSKPLVFRLKLKPRHLLLPQYKMTEVDYPRGSVILAQDEVVKELVVIRDGFVTIEHPRGKIALATLSAGEIIGSEALLKRISAPRRQGVPVPFEVASTVSFTATSAVRCYRLGLDEVVRNCAGGIGIKTQTLLREWLELQHDRRRTFFTRQRALQTRQSSMRAAAVDSWHPSVVLKKLQERDQTINAHCFTVLPQSLPSLLPSGGNTVSIKSNCGNRRPQGSIFGAPGGVKFLLLPTAKC